jgi:hypothetical protein
MKIKLLNQFKGISNSKFQGNSKCQIPNSKFQKDSKFQGDSKFQIPNSTFSIFKFGSRNLGIWNLGIWNLGILGIFGIMFSCNSKPKSTVANGVNPFDTTHFETQALSPEDRAKLANAQGKTVQPIDIDALAAKINTATGKLHLFCFWNLESANSVSTLKAVNSLSAKFDSTKLDIIFVNMPGRQTMEAINLFIRENQLSDETLILEKADVSFFSKRIKKEFTGVTGLPVIILANKADETLQFINRAMDEKELSAIIQPLL